VKTNQGNQVQNSFMRHVFSESENAICGAQWALMVQSPQKPGIRFPEGKVTFNTVSYRKMGAQDVLFAPPFCWGSNCSPNCSPVPRICLYIPFSLGSQKTASCSVKVSRVTFSLSMMYCGFSKRLWVHRKLSAVTSIELLQKLWTIVMSRTCADRS